MRYLEKAMQHDWLKSRRLVSSKPARLFRPTDGINLSSSLPTVGASSTVKKGTQHMSKGTGRTGSDPKY